MAGAFQSDAFQNDAFQTEGGGGSTASDSVTTSDAATRLLVASRATSDSVSISDAAVALVVAARSASDAVTTSDAIVAVKSLLRSVADSVSSSDSAIRALSLLRAISDAVATIDEAIAETAVVTATDAVTTSDSATTTKNLVRSVSDSASTSDSASRLLAASRSVSDSTSTSDVAVAAVPLTRTASDSVTTSDAATQAKTLYRTISGSVTATGTQNETGSVNRTAVDFVAAHGQATIPGVQLPGDPPVIVGQEPIQAEVRIYLDGVEVTDDVEYGTARFRSLVNGQPGEAAMRLRDLSLSVTPRKGADWLLVIDGQAVWRGFVTSVKRKYIAPAMNVSVPGVQRFYDLEGADLNFLFLRRVVHKKSDPDSVAGTKYDAGTMDRRAIMDLIDDWLTLGDDDLDTSTWVDQIAELDPEQKTRAWSGGWYWGDAMASINTIPNGVWYIRPEIGTPKGSLVYADVDVPDSPYLLSDAPNTTTGSPEILFLDEFGRVVASGLGGDYTVDATDGSISVNGSEAVAGNGVDYSYWTGWNTSIPHPADFDLLFDFSTPPAAGENPYLWINLGMFAIELFPNIMATPIQYWFAGYKMTSDTTSTMEANDTALLLDPELVYRVRVRQDGTTASMRIWLVTDSEPTAWDYTWSVSGGFDSQFWMDFESGGDGTIQTLDNLTVMSLGSTPVLNRKGYREMEITLDATHMANDVLAWGMGYGSQEPVFRRVQSASSQAEHGLWQTAEVKTGVYKQGTINRIADSILNGSPASKRGAKDDRPMVSLVTYQPGFLAGQKVEFESIVWDYTDVIPIRDMEVTFESPTAPRYQLHLSHEIDQPWSSINSWWPALPNLPSIPPIDPWTPCPPFCPPPPPPNCDDTTCGITDTFTRTVSGGWGTSDYGTAWWEEGSGGAYGEKSVHDGVGEIKIQNDANGWAFEWLGFNNPVDPTFQASWIFQYTGSIIDSNQVQFYVGSCYVDIESIGSGDWRFTIGSHGGGTPYNLYVDDDTISFSQDTWYNMRFERVDGGDLRAKFWAVGDTEPDWILTLDISSRSWDTEVPVFGARSLGTGGSDYFIFQIDNFDISGLSKCDAVQFDDFNRTVASGLGDTLHYGPWVQNAATSGTSVSVDGSVAVLALPAHSYLSGDSKIEYEVASGPFNERTWEMVCRFSPIIGNAPGPSNVETQWYLDNGTTRQTLTADAYTDSVYITGPNSIVANVGFDMVATGWYWIRWRYDAANLMTQVRCWQDGDVEPVTWLPIKSGDVDTDIQLTLVDPAASSFGIASYFKTTVTASASQSKFDFIEFYYDGMPCYIDCGVFDDFNRTRASDWGTSSSGYAWDTSGSGTVASVNGSSGSLSTIDAAFVPVTASALIDSDGPWQGAFTMTTSFTLSGSAGSNFIILVYSAESGTLLRGSVIIDPVTSKIWVGDGGGTHRNSASFTYYASTTWNLKWVWPAVTPGTSTVTIWNADDPEPGTPTVSYTGAFDTFPDVTNPSLEILAVTAFAHQTNGIHFDYIDFGECVDIGGGPATPPTTPSGFGFDTLVRIDDFTYSTSSQYTAGSTAVYRNGTLQIRGTDYTEDAGSQSVTFTTAIDPGDSITANYQVVSGPDPAFLSRPSSAPLSYNGSSSVNIDNVSINGGSRDSVSGIGISISNVNGPITIRNVDLANLVGGIYIYNCTGTLTIENVRSRNIGDGTIGSGHGNHIQLAETKMSGHISGCKFLGGLTEDMVSIWHSGGVGTGSELIVQYNAFQGLVSDSATARAWDSTSGTGVILSDGAGSANAGNIICRYNTFLTPGQVGIQCVDGPNLQVYGNTIYGQKRPQNNNPMTTWEGDPQGYARDNRYWWTNNDDTHPDPWEYPGGTDMDFSNNTADSTIDPATLVIVLV